MQIAAGGTHTRALLESGNVRCSGDSAYGQTGYSTTNDNVGDNETPASMGDVSIGDDVTDLSTGGNHTCAALANGTIRCWGDNMSGQLGYLNTTDVGDTEVPSAAGPVQFP